MKTLLIYFLFISALLGQDESKNMLGLSLGLSFSHIEGAEKRFAGNINEPTNNVGLTIGVNYRIYFNEINSQQFELYFMEKGSKWGQPLIGLGYDGNYAIYDLSFVGISILHKFNSRIGNLFKKFDFCFGAFYEYNVKAKQSWIVEIDSPTEFHAKDFRDEINKHQFGFILGAKFPFFFESTRLSLLWHYSITELYNDQNVIYAEYDFEDKDGLTGRTFSLTIEYLLTKL